VVAFHQVLDVDLEGLCSEAHQFLAVHFIVVENITQLRNAVFALLAFESFLVELLIQFALDRQYQADLAAWVTHTCSDKLCFTSSDEAYSIVLPFTANTKNMTRITTWQHQWYITFQAFILGIALDQQAKDDEK
jgi:hypothetical protein